MSNAHGSHWLQREDIGDVTVVRINVPRLEDDNTTREAFETIYTLVETQGRNKLVVNLANVKAMLSLGMGKLVMLNRKAQVAGGRMVLCQLAPVVAESVYAVHLDRLLSIYDTEAEAVKALS
jgi:anti-sigma B factor antagonist